MLDKFCKMLFAIGQVRSERSSSDIVGELPTEVVANIFRYLEPKDLVNAASVNRRWYSVCKGDIILRRNIHEQIVKERENRIQSFYNATRSFDLYKHNSFRILAQRNGRISVEYKPIKLGTFNRGGILKMRKRTQIHPVEQMFPKRKRDDFVNEDWHTKRSNIRL